MMCMDKICGVATGVIFLISGASLLAYGLGMLSAMIANVVAGALFVLAGLSFAIHALGMCPICKCDDKCCK